MPRSDMPRPVPPVGPGCFGGRPRKAPPRTSSPYGPNGVVYPGYPPLLPGKFLRHMRDTEDPHGTLKLAKQVRIVDEVPGDETLASYNEGDLVIVSSTGRLYRVVANPSTGARSLELLPFTAETDVKPFPRYLHYLRFDDSYDADANAWYESLSPSAMGGACSAIRRGAVFGRNYDWNHDEAAEFVVEMGAAKGANSDGSDRHSSVGVASLGSALTESDATSGTYTPKIRALPGMTLDGINDSGVVAEINVVPRGSGDPVRSSVRNLHPLAVVRYVLDRFSSAEDAAEYVAARYYIPSTSAYSFHWMIADASKTFIVEDGVCHEVDGTDCSMTNYRLYATDVYGTGYARKDVLDGSTDVWSALSSTLFTNAYATGWPWPDEFSGDAHIPHSESTALRAWADAHVTPHLDPVTRKPKTRDGVLWHTVHTSIYDFAAKTMKVAVQESGEYFTFAAVKNESESKRDKNDFRVYRKKKDIWHWTPMTGSEYPDAPEDFLETANAANAQPLFYSSDLGGWFGATQFWPNGNRKYLAELPPGGEGSELTLNFAFTSYAEDGETVLGRFEATATRESATDETLVYWDNEFVRLATTETVEKVRRVIEGKLTPVAPSTDASDDALAGAKATANFVNSSINAFAAFYITADAQGNAFATKAALNAAIVSGEFYNGGARRVPTKNDYLIVREDESVTPTIPGVNPTTRYSYDGSQWAFQYIVNNTALTQAQVDAINSGITAAKVAQIKPLDDDVTRTSANGVKSSGIWSAIWGALTALPSGFTSLYDWCVAQFAKKVDAVRVTIPVGAYTFTNGVNGFQAWAWKDENDEWHCVCVNKPSNCRGAFIKSIFDDDTTRPYVVAFDRIGASPYSNLLYIRESETHDYYWDMDAGGYAWFGGEIEQEVTTEAVTLDIANPDDGASIDSDNVVTSRGIYKFVVSVLAFFYNSFIVKKLDKTDVIPPSSATELGKAADAFAVKNNLAGKADTSDLAAKLDKADVVDLEDADPDKVQAANASDVAINMNSKPSRGEVETIIANSVDPYVHGSIDIAIVGGKWISIPDSLLKLAPMFDPEKVGGYAVGDFVCSNDQTGEECKIYQCVAATSGGWDSTKWRERNLLSLFSSENGLGNSWIDGRIASGVPSLIAPYTHYDLIDKTAVEGEVTLADRTFNRVAVSAATTFTLPTAITGKARDLAIYIKASVAEATLSFDETTNTIRGDDMPVTAVGGEYLVLLTEIDSVNGKTVWNCSVKDITPAA